MDLLRAPVDRRRAHPLRPTITASSDPGTGRSPWRGSATTAGGRENRRPAAFEGRSGEGRRRCAREAPVKALGEGRRLP